MTEDVRYPTEEEARAFLEHLENSGAFMQGGLSLVYQLAVIAHDIDKRLKALEGQAHDHAAETLKVEPGCGVQVACPQCGGRLYSVVHGGCAQ